MEQPTTHVTFEPEPQRPGRSIRGETPDPSAWEARTRASRGARSVSRDAVPRGARGDPDSLRSGSRSPPLLVAT